MASNFDYSAYFNTADKASKVGTIESMLSGVASGLIAIPKGFFSLGASLMDLGVNSGKAAAVEQWFDDLTEFDEKAEATAAGKITEALVNIGIPGGLAFKSASGMAKTAMLAGKNNKYVRMSNKNLQNAADEALELTAAGKGRQFVAGALGGSELLKGLGITVEPDALLARSTGNIINPNAELLFQGPVLRDFGFQYLMIARSREEGEQIRKIIRWFKQGAAPKYRNQALLGTPDIFSLEYKTPGNPGIMNKFNDLALRTITVDYAPDGFWSAYEDSHPVAVRMSLQFTELKPVYDVDQNKSPDDNSVGY